MPDEKKIDTKKNNIKISKCKKKENFIRLLKLKGFKKVISYLNFVPFHFNFGIFETCFQIKTQIGNTKTFKTQKCKKQFMKIKKKNQFQCCQISETLNIFLTL